MKEPDFKHYFKVIGGKFVWESPDMFEYIKRNLEGKRGFAVITEVSEDISMNQYAYYFGGIIRKECMNSEAFQSMKERDIHNFLLRELRGSAQVITDKNGNNRIVEQLPDFGSFGKKAMAQYISEVIAYLQTEFDIHPKPAEHYKYNKFYIKPKTFSYEELEGNT